ncbi:MAG TPA: HypC/HybG/HupF family hydrogenase formation chaperone [Bacteroidales bacterium]|jgi:hydrogenase expression/formation protein HypC|nr:HypC/HybG/HupF family hydrogenase formation chaperone [Bacteroidales bacterium]
MCLSVPAKIVKIEGDIAQASIGGSIIDVGLQLIEKVEIGDYVLVHTGFALEKIDEKEAKETLEMLNDMVEEDPEDMIAYIEI